mmetsp:Transcript_47924/g.113908  ORF Transcript_47924/g.113908 Transcript_47924/m.113908 type:complete len:270 (-) Transcript_47924:1217-2026(-)
MQLPASLGQVYLQTSQLLGLLHHRLLALLQKLLLDVGLLPQDAKLIVPVDELDACEVSRLHSLLILASQCDHLLFDLVDGRVELVILNDVLLDGLIEVHTFCSDPRLLGLERLLRILKSLCLLTRSLELLVFEGAFHSQNLHLILENLQLLLHLGQMLRRFLDVCHVLVSLILHHLVHRAELLLLLVDLLVLLLEVIFLQLLHRNFVRSVTIKPVSSGSIPRKLLPLRRESLEVARPLLLLSLQVLQLLLHLFHLLVDGLQLVLLLLLQ